MPATPATADDVARLFGRAAFGATKSILTTYTGMPYDQVVDALFPPATGRTPSADEARLTQLQQKGDQDLLAAQRWWLERMRSTAYPIEERMAWFWHTHFPVAYQNRPDVSDLLIQNAIMRANALGDFRQLVYQLTVDPAMLFWLSGFNSYRNHVNENYGRELMELFVAGTVPQQYTETDIREAAKALTGFYLNNNKTAFAPGNHVMGTKSVCGRTIGGYPSGDVRETTEYQAVVDAVLALPSSSYFIAYKLVASFAYLPDLSGVPNRDVSLLNDPLIEAVATALRPAQANGVWDIGSAVKTLLKHDGFRYANKPAGYGVIRTPVELVVHLTKSMGVTCDPVQGINNTNGANVNLPIQALRPMGQVPFQPPSVGGWPKGKRWLSASTTEARYAMGQYVYNAYIAQHADTVTPLPASGDLAGWIAYLGLGSLSATATAQVQAYQASPGTTDEKTKQVSMLLLLTSSPDWQVM